jgi:hypothetical protein
MGPGVRRQSLFNKIQEAVKEETTAIRALEDFEDSLAEEPTRLAEWKADIQRWEATKEGLNPYESRVAGMLPRLEYDKV